MSFKMKSTEEILLFNKEIKSKVKKTYNLKKNHTILNLYLNKVNNENYLVQCRKFLQENYLTENKMDEFTIEFYFKLISEDNFMESYLLFYKTIIENYYNFTKYDFSYFINLIETKFLMDFTNEKMLLQDVINKHIKIPDNLNDIEKQNYIKSYKLNNLKLIHLLIKHNILKKDIEKHILNNLNEYEDKEFIYHFINITNNIDYIDNIDINKLSLRFQTLFKELLNKKKSNEKEFTIVKSKPKTSHKTMIHNIIEEYLFNEEIDEVNTFIENYVLKKNLQVLFVETSILYGKKNDTENEIYEMLELVKSTLKKKPVINKKNL